MEMKIHLNYSYVSLLTNESYIYGIILLYQSLLKVSSKYPLYVLVTKNVSMASREILNQLNISYEVIDIIPMQKDLFQHNYDINSRFAATWKNCFTKFYIFNLTKFDKIVFLDADVQVLKNIDHLFEKPHMTAAIDGEYFSLWNDKHFNAGCMVIEPSENIYQDLLSMVKILEVKNLPSQCIADQEILNIYFNEWPEKRELHLNKYYNVFSPYIMEEQVKDIKQNAYFIHFIGRKPWSFWVYNPEEHYSEYFYTEAKRIIQEYVNTLDWGKIRSKLKLTVYAICKNEKENVNKWLKCFSPADYICILDTGSTDGTWEALNKAKKKYKNLIIKQKIISPWRFDEARNASMELIPEDSVIQFMADLDEEIKDINWCQKIKVVWDPLFDRGMYQYHRDIEPDGTIRRTIQEFRVHSKEWTHWENVVHEAIVKDSGQRQFFMETCTPLGIEVWHYPKKTKEVDYATLCEQELIEHPNNWVMCLQLAIEYEIKKDWEKAILYYKRIIETPNNPLQAYEKARAYSGLGKYLSSIGKNDEAQNYFREGRLIEPSFTDNYFDSAILYFNDKKFDKTIELIETSMSKCPISNWCSVYDTHSHYSYWLLGLSYYNKRDLHKALSYVAIAYSIYSIEEYKMFLNQIIEEIKKEW